MLFITDIKLRPEESTFHHWTKSSGFCDLNHSIEVWFLVAYSWTNQKAFMDFKSNFCEKLHREKNIIRELTMWTETI